MRLLATEALTFDDILLQPAHSTILPADADIKTQLTRNIALNIPLLSSAMDTVTEARLAIAMAQEGGIGIIHKNMSIEEQVRQVRQVKKFESGVVAHPITVQPNTSVRDVLKITQDNHISGLPVVEGEQLVGIVTHRDVRFENHLDQPVSNIMTPKERLVTVTEGAKREDILTLLHQNRIEKILVVNDNFALRGLITVKDIQKAKEKPLASKDEQGQLRVGAAVGIGQGAEDRIMALISVGVDVLVVDTAHGHSQRVLDKIQWIKQHYPDVDVIGGNIATAEAAQAMYKVGADGVKVGIGPGSICTTRVIAGVGVPQVSAIAAVAAELKKRKIPLIADGGIRHSGDIVKAIAAGAHSVMMGSLFAGTEEAPGEVELYHGRSYKSYRGMGSLAAMAETHGSSDRYFQDVADDGTKKLVPEGIEGRVPYKGSVLAIIQQMIGGLRAGMGYTGCANIDAMRTQTQFIKISAASMRESHVHDVTITKEAPNYQGNRN